jgi:hypothetical protein
VSFSADTVLATWFFIRSCLRHFFHGPSDPNTLAEARAIDMGIQFLLFWTPFVTLLGWWLNKPMSLLFGQGLFFVLMGPPVRLKDPLHLDLFEVILSSVRAFSSTTSRRTPRRAGRRAGSSRRSTS